MNYGVSAVCSRAQGLAGDRVRSRGRARPRRFVQALLLEGMALGLAATGVISCANRDNPDEKAEAAHGEAATGVIVTTILENPTNYIGKTVTVSGEVEDLRGPRAFTVGGKDWLSGELLILSAEPFPTVKGREGNAQLAEGDLVQVTGSVRRFTAAEIEKEIGFDLDRELEKDFENKPVLVVKSKAMLITPHSKVTDRVGALVGSADGSLLGLGETGQGDIGQPQQTDAGKRDAGHTDAGHTDAGHTDAGKRDAGKADAGRR